MSSRERTLAIVLLGLIVLGGGGFAAYTFAYQPYLAKKAEAEKLQRDISELDLKVLAITKERANIAHVKRASLPPDVNLAKKEYSLLMERLLQQARITEYKMPEAREVDKRAPITPEMAPKKPAYKTLVFTIDIQRANIWQVVDFLRGYYQLDLLHQITDLKITRENKPNESRNGLEVHIVSEAIILDGAEPRTSLFPVTPAVAAAVGMAGLQAVALNPELARKLTSSPATPVLAPGNRDYSLLALRDMFYGKLPSEPPPPPFALGKFRDVVIPYPPPTEPITVRVTLSGEGSVGATVTARAAGGLLTEGPLSVDPKTNTVTIPAVTLAEDLDPRATSTVTIEATSADGKTKKKESFRVSLAPAPQQPVVVPKDDIAGVIRLVGVSGSSLGTMTAIIHDPANPFRYKIEASARSVTVTKHYLKAKGDWGKDPDYEHPSGVLAISDDGATATNRTFKVIAIDANGLLLLDIAKPEVKETKSDPRGPGRMPGRPGGGAAALKQGPAEPLAVVAGNVVTAIPPPKLYRWVPGKSLAELVLIPPAEARVILNRVAAEGPLGFIASGN